METPAQGGEVVFEIEVLPRHALADRVGELAAEESDKQFEDCVALPAKLRHGPGVDADVPRRRQHMDQPVAQRGVVHPAFSCAFDLRQDFKLAVGRSDHSNYATGAQPSSAVFQYPITAAPREVRYLRHRRNAIRLRRRDLILVLAIADTLPFADRTADHASASPL